MVWGVACNESADQHAQSYLGTRCPAEKAAIQRPAKSMEGLFEGTCVVYSMSAIWRTASVHAQALGWRIPEKALSLVTTPRPYLIDPRKTAMPRVTRPTQTIDLGIQSTDSQVGAGMPPSPSSISI